ncbi:Uncharacterised protein, partial [Metamycoplasma alkalescens]
MFFGAKEFDNDLFKLVNNNKVTDLQLLFYNAEKFNKSLKHW